jgi:pimeloyl-ACP methyl ester carboxylesterase
VSHETAPFSQRHVDVDGARVRYMEAGEGAGTVWLQGPGASRLTLAHELLSGRSRVFVFEASNAMPLIGRAIDALGLEVFNVIGTSSATTAALSLALQAPARVHALVLEAPAALDGDTDLEGRLSDVAAPTLVVLGTVVDAGPAATARMYKARIPNSHLVLVYAAGPSISSDRPEAFADVVADFLERREAFVISRTPTMIHP